MHPSMFKKSLKGFTLIELLIVVAIIAILAAIAVPNFLEAQVRSKVSRAKADMRTLATGLESYYVDANSYPDADTTGMSPAIKLGVEYSRRTLSKLSTPISYLTNALYADPFAVGSANTNFYGYANAQAALPYLGAVGVSATDAQKGEFQQNLWVLQSVGPDRLNFALQQGNPSQNFPLAFKALTDRTDVSFFYDSTNGTISTGDIVKTAKFQ